ncbi:hypothetical protein TIFTF001_030068 [Ficus carica]|uniref:Uncharacterized protein n=1 Tax=Ficus carica TaxID=3494 RepID=A0AA88J2A5_FICCA|nr:hypothetical protein TIFTF001_030068 [Ficus carica]
MAEVAGLWVEKRPLSSHRHEIQMSEEIWPRQQLCSNQMLLGEEKASHLRFFLPSSHLSPNLSSTPAPTASHPIYSPSINVQKSLLKQHIGARDVGVVPSTIAAFDAVVVFVATTGHITAAVPTSEVL